jgi:hypothetical protein
MSEPKIRIQVNVYEDGTVVGSNDESDGSVLLEFDDFVRAIQGLVSWAAELLTETNDDSAKEIGSAMLISALHEWTFAEEHREDEDGISEDEDTFEDEDSLPPDETP